MFKHKISQCVVLMFMEEGANTFELRCNRLNIYLRHPITLDLHPVIYILTRCRKIDTVWSLTELKYKNMKEITERKFGE